MNLQDVESRTDLTYAPQVSPDATEYSREWHITSASNYLVLVSAGDTGTQTGPAETGRLAMTLRTGGFKPWGSRTAQFTDPADVALARIIKQTSTQDIQKLKNRGAATLIQSWLNADEQVDAEHRETLDYLINALDEDRPSDRKLFP